MKKIVILFGNSGSGKDTVADYLVTTYNFKRMSLASQLKEIVWKLISVGDPSFYFFKSTIENSPYLKDTFTNRRGFSIRDLYQDIGTYLKKRISLDLWINHLLLEIDKAEDNSSIVISDCRSSYEIKKIQEYLYDKADIVVVKISRIASVPLAVYTIYSCLGNNIFSRFLCRWIHKKSSHFTEAEAIALKISPLFDFYLDNNSDIECLYSQIDFLHGKL